MLNFDDHRDEFPLLNGSLQEDGTWRSEEHVCHQSRWEHIREKKPVTRQIQRNSARFIVNGFFAFGKAEGTFVGHADTSYLEWLSDQDWLDTLDHMVVQQELAGRSSDWAKWTTHRIR